MRQWSIHWLMQCFSTILAGAPHLFCRRSHLFSRRPTPSFTTPHFFTCLHKYFHSPRLHLAPSKYSQAPPVRRTPSVGHHWTGAIQCSDPDLDVDKDHLDVTLNTPIAVRITTDEQKFIFKCCFLELCTP